jgi:hypothetical protein
VFLPTLLVIISDRNLYLVAEDWRSFWRILWQNVEFQAQAVILNFNRFLCSPIDGAPHVMKKSLPLFCKNALEHHSEFSFYETKLFILRLIQLSSL